ncbi:MAG: protoporphyrinogen oxidase [Acidimicrobiales bacterium]
MTEPGRRPAIAVVGGGIAGLAAAWELTGGADGPEQESPAVVLVEAAERLGGKLRSEPFAGTVVDVGPDGFLGRRPEAEQLCREVGLGDRLTPIGAAGATVWVGGRARPLPGSLAMGVPTRFLPTARSGILGPAGTARLLFDVVAPRPDRRGPLGDRAVGPLVARKLGRRVVTRLVDPLVGGIYAGAVDDASAAAVYPLLLAAAQRRGSFLRALRRSSDDRPSDDRASTSGPTASPAFWAVDGGLGLLAVRLAAALSARGVEIRTGCPVERLEPPGTSADRWTVHTATGPVAVDGVVLATPAGPAAALLDPHDAEAANLLRAIEYAAVGVVTLELAPGAVPDELPGTGMLFPPDTRLPDSAADALGGPADGRLLVTACTFLSRKWPHLAGPDHVLVRASVGRFGDRRFAELADDALVARVSAELGALLGTGGAGRPTDAQVTRWDEALPQYRVHHLLRVAGIEAALERLPAITVTGAAYRGVGIPACIAGGRAAARLLRRRLEGVPATT